nr:TonB-dependent receptor [uncultured Brevundimonas sp.]
MRLMGYAAAAALLAAAPAAIAQTTEFNIPAGSLKNGLDSWSRATSRELLYREDQVTGVRTAGARGVMTPEAALGTLLERTGFTVRFDPSGAVAVVRAEGNVEGEYTEVPEVLVMGNRNWSLNTGIRRSRDDSQPFIVMTQEDIRRSGAADLDTFLRNQLSVNANPTTADQVGRGAVEQRGLSSINLRGLGSRETLILVDGRRQAGVNLGTGQLNQGQITGIPLSAIERIEVLASSASGIYGSGASGGVINIILKRGFEGGELSATYADTSDFSSPDGRIDGTYARTLNAGRTRVSASGSWRRSEPLLYGDRSELLARNHRLMLENDPDYYDTAGLAFSSPIGATPNFKSLTGERLSLKPQFGGQLLTSSIGFIPDGYRGVAADGLAPLLGSLGSYNFDQPDSATGIGRRAPVVYGADSLSAMGSIRHEFTDRVAVYGEIAGSQVKSTTVTTRSPSVIYLSANAPNNPFQQDLAVTLPQGDAEAEVSSRNDQWRALAGAIIQLPGDWQALADISYNATRFKNDRTPTPTATAFDDALAAGEQDILRDLRDSPLQYSFIPGAFGSFSTPADSRVTGASLRLAGPAPVKLPGGRPQLTLNLEYSREDVGAVRSANNSSLFSYVSFVPDRSQTIGAAYAEAVFPIFSAENAVPLVELLELRVAARYERYEGRGALGTINCAMVYGPLPSGDPFADCPPAGLEIERATTTNEHTDPSVSLRWSPVRDLMFRGSYTTGYLPPRLDQLIKRDDVIYTTANDPLRGGEPVGTPGPFGNQLLGAYGGNTEVKPESSKTWSAGVIVTPRWLSGLRFSADWTRITKRDNYFDPLSLLFAGGNPPVQAAFEQFLAAYPERVVRGPASDGFAVGPITYLDASLANLVGSKAEAVDFALDYSTNAFGGVLDLMGSATWVRELSVERLPGQPGVDYTGVSTSDFGNGFSDQGSLEWRGNLSARWTRGPVSLGWAARYFDGYYLQASRALVERQGSARVASQTYHDMFATFTRDELLLKVGINNVFGKSPPFDYSAFPVYYSRYGDPRLRNFTLTVTRRF